MKLAIVVVLWSVLSLVAASAEAQSCVSDCGCPPGQTCQPTEEGGLCKESTCPLDYRPVCGLDGKTYSNACQASLDRVGVAHDGECEGATGDGDNRSKRPCNCCHPTLVSDQGTVIWSGDPDLGSASRAGTGRYRLIWNVDVTNDALFVQPIAPYDDFPRSLLGWPARIDSTEVEVITDAHYGEGPGPHGHRDALDVQFSLLRCPQVEAD